MYSELAEVRWRARRGSRRRGVARVLLADSLVWVVLALVCVVGTWCVGAVPLAQEEPEDHDAIGEGADLLAGSETDRLEKEERVEHHEVPRLRLDDQSNSEHHAPDLEREEERAEPHLSHAIHDEVGLDASVNMPQDGSSLEGTHLEPQNGTYRPDLEFHLHLDDTTLQVSPEPIAADVERSKETADPAGTNPSKTEWSGPVFHAFGMVGVPPWMLGVILGTFGYTLCGLGMNLIRLSHLVYSGGGGLASSASHTNLRETAFNRKSSRGRSRLVWIAGYGFNTLGGSMNVAGLRYAAQSLMAPLSSMALVSNAFFATYLLGEKLHFEKDLPPMLMIGMGNVITVLSANHRGYKQLSLTEFSFLVQRGPFQLYLCMVSIGVVLLVLLRQRYADQVARAGGREFANQLLVAKVGLFHAAAGCVLCVHSVFLSKASMLILAEATDNLRQPALIGVLSGWIGLGALWVYTLNRLLGEYDALFIVPVIEVVWSLQSMIGGGIFFEEFAAISPGRLMCFLLGVAVNISGVWLLSRRHDRRQKSAE